jgi:hypothetical protein
MFTPDAPVVTKFLHANLGAYSLALEKKYGLELSRRWSGNGRALACPHSPLERQVICLINAVTGEVKIWQKRTSGSRTYLAQFDSVIKVS